MTRVSTSSRSEVGAASALTVISPSPGWIVPRTNGQWCIRHRPAIFSRGRLTAAKRETLSLRGTDLTAARTCWTRRISAPHGFPCGLRGARKGRRRKRGRHREEAMQVSLAGRTAVITGASKGIGLAIATRFAASGADVAIVARGHDALDDAAKAIGASGGGRVHAIQGDVAVPADVQRTYDEAMRAFGKIDIVVNNAGTSRTGAFEEITDEIWREDFDQKLFAAIRLTRLAWPQMKARRWGRIINTLNIGAKA